MEQSGENQDQGNVVPLTAARAAKSHLPVEPYLTDEERREIRAMLAYFRRFGPRFEAVCQSCPTARFILDE